MKKLYFLLTVLISQVVFLTVRSNAINTEEDDQESLCYNHRVKKVSTRTEDGKESLHLVGNF